MGGAASAATTFTRTHSNACAVSVGNNEVGQASEFLGSKRTEIVNQTIVRLLPVVTRAKQ